jgi:hypothetical protein
MPGLDRHRTDSMKGYARKLGMHFHAEDEFGLLRLLRDFKLFRRGHSRKINNILKASTLDLTTHIFDYTYIIGKGKDRRYRRQTVMFVNSKELGLPSFSMQPESLWNKLTDWLKITTDIDFDSHPEFSEQYFLRAEDEDLIRYIYDENVLEFFTINKNWHLEGMNYFLVFYSLNERFHPKLLESFYHTGIKLFDLLKSHPNALDLDHPL